MEIDPTAEANVLSTSVVGSDAASEGREMDGTGAAGAETAAAAGLAPLPEGELGMDERVDALATPAPPFRDPEDAGWRRPAAAPIAPRSRLLETCTPPGGRGNGRLPMLAGDDDEVERSRLLVVSLRWRSGADAAVGVVSLREVSLRASCTPAGGRADMAPRGL